MYCLHCQPNRPSRQLELGELGLVHLRSGSHLPVTDEQAPSVRQALEALPCSADYQLRELEAPRRPTARAQIQTPTRVPDATGEQDAPAAVAESTDQTCGAFNLEKGYTCTRDLDHRGKCHHLHVGADGPEVIKWTPGKGQKPGAE